MDARVPLCARTAAPRCHAGRCAAVMQDGRRAPPATRGMEVGRALTRLPPDPHVRPRARSGTAATPRRGGMMELHILLVGDDADHADAMRRALVRMEAGVRVTTAARLERALEALRDPAIRCVVTDVRLPDADGVRVLQALRSARRDLPVIVVTANGSEELAVAAMKPGAADYVSRHARYTEELPLLVREALGRSVLSAVHEACLDGVLPARAGPDAAAFIATTENMRAVLTLVERAALSTVPVLLEGETGTGKELLARATHRRAARPHAPPPAPN